MRKWWIIGQENGYDPVEIEINIDSEDDYIDLAVSDGIGIESGYVRLNRDTVLRLIEILYKAVEEVTPQLKSGG